jgi:hypothetical protein
MTQTALSAYATRIDRLMSSDTVKFDRTKAHTNTVIGALHHEQFETFTANFDARIQRLKNWSDGHTNAHRFVAHALNWDGAYSELAAADYIATVCNIPAKYLSFDQSQPASMTLASEMGMTNVDYDFGIRGGLCYLDVKVLSDKSRQIVEGIVKQIKKKLGLEQLQILSFFPTDTDYSGLVDNRAALLTELESSLSGGKKPKSIRSKIITELKYEPVWNSGVFSHATSYSPDQHADAHHKLLFQHAKKFHRSRPSLLIFVQFPWSGEALVPMQSEDLPKRFFSSMCSRFFTNYDGSRLLGSQVLGKVQTGITADAITRKLAGVIFLEDAAITSEQPDSANVTASFYMNPRFHRRFLSAPICLYLRQNAQDLRR